VHYDRLIGVTCLGGIAVTHLLDLPDKLEEAPYMAVMFCGLIAASAGLAIVLASRRDAAIVWYLACAIATLPLAGYVLSRSVALPQLEDHVGDWLNPAGVASLIFEVVLIAVSLIHVSRRSGPRTQGRRLDHAIRSR
jgi:uncharacterized membrane protein